MPFWNKVIVGIAETWLRYPRVGTSSVFTFATTNRPAVSLATLRSSGATILHGAHPWRPEIHQYRQSRLAYQRNAKSLGTSTGSLGGVNSVWHLPQRNDRFNASYLRRLRCPQFWASHEQSVIVCSNHTHNEVSRLEVCPRVIWILSSAI
jgi:hypothetical protein